MTVASSAALPSSESAHFLLEISDLVNGTLDLDQVLNRVGELVQRVIAYDIFAILLVSERAPHLRMRYAVGHLPEVVARTRVSLRRGIVGRAARTRLPQRVADVGHDADYIAVLEGVRSELAVPLLWKNRAIGVIDIQSRQPDAFSESHLRALQLIAGRVTSAVANARLYRNAGQREKTLRLLNEISRDMTSILAVDALLTRAAELVKRVIDYQLFSVLTLNAAGDTLEHRISVKSGQHVQIKHDIPLGKGLCGAAAAERAPVLARDVRRDPRYLMVNPETRAELVVPLLYQDRVLGVLDLEHPRVRYYTRRHVRTMTTLAAQMAVALENARLYQHVVRQERQAQRELRMAQEVQRHLLPAHPPTPPGLEIAARAVAARQLGGDLYDFFPYKGHRLGIAIGDVSGKGAGAALYGALVSGLLRAQAAQQPEPGDLLAALNQSLFDRNVENQFMTLILALWHERGRRLVVANSGLPFPIHVTPQGCHAVAAAGVPLGMLPGTQYESVELRLGRGDLVVFISDGITETMNPQGAEFGRQRLEALLRQLATAPAAEVVQAVFAAAEAFGAGQPAADDRTVLVIKARKDEKPDEKPEKNHEIAPTA